MTAKKIEELVDHLVETQQEELFFLKYHWKFYGRGGENDLETIEHNLFYLVANRIYKEKGVTAGSLFVLNVEKKTGFKINV